MQVLEGRAGTWVLPDAKINDVIAAGVGDADLLWREFAAVHRQEDVDQRREQRRIFGWIEADQTQGVLEVGRRCSRGRSAPSINEPSRLSRTTAECSTTTGWRRPLVK